jgi:hypothetical protein
MQIRLPYGTLLHHEERIEITLSLSENKVQCCVITLKIYIISWNFKIFVVYYEKQRSLFIFELMSAKADEMVYYSKHSDGLPDLPETVTYPEKHFGRWQNSKSQLTK